MVVEETTTVVEEPQEDRTLWPWVALLGLVVLAVLGYLLLRDDDRGTAVTPPPASPAPVVVPPAQPPVVVQPPAQPPPVVVQPPAPPPPTVVVSQAPPAPAPS